MPWVIGSVLCCEFCSFYLSGAALSKAESSPRVLSCIQTLHVCLVFLQAGKSKIKELAGQLGVWWGHFLVPMSCPGEEPETWAHPCVPTVIHHHRFMFAFLLLKIFSKSSCVLTEYQLKMKDWFSWCIPLFPQRHRNYLLYFDRCKFNRTKILKNKGRKPESSLLLLKPTPFPFH